MAVERDPKRKRDVIKKVIAYMTLGIDVSRLFTEMVRAWITGMAPCFACAPAQFGAG